MYLLSLKPQETKEEPQAGKEASTAPAEAAAASAAVTARAPPRRNPQCGARRAGAASALFGMQLSAGMRRQIVAKVGVRAVVLVPGRLRASDSSQRGA